MGISEILAIIKGVLAFPETILKFIKLLQATPQEDHDKILEKIQKEAESFKKDGRPTWDI